MMLIVCIDSYQKINYTPQYLANNLFKIKQLFFLVLNKIKRRKANVTRCIAQKILFSSAIQATQGCKTFVTTM
jgi:hypothetical protein